VQLCRLLRAFHLQMGADRIQRVHCGKYNRFWTTYTNHVAHQSHGFQVTSIGLITFGSIILVISDDFYENAAVSAITLIVFGSATFFFAFLGCYGSIKKSYSMLYLVRKSESLQLNLMCYFLNHITLS
jgi:hypothetical protein